MLLYLIGFWKTVGKSWLKNLTALLAEICQPGAAQIILDEEDSRVCEGGRSRQRGKERERERERERVTDDIWIQATFQRTVSFPSPCLCFQGLLDTKAISGLLHEIFTLSWPVSRNMSVASSPPCWATMPSQRTRGVGQGKRHPLFSLSGKGPSY